MGIMGLAAPGYRFGEPDLPAEAISLSLKSQVSVRREALHIRASLYGAIRDRLYFWEAPEQAYEDRRAIHR
jgi:hypothetical protein